MALLPRLLASYGRYHRHPKNRLTHYFGVPLIIFSLLIAASLVRIHAANHVTTLATVLVVLFSCFYILLDWKIGFIVSAVLIPLGYLADLLTQDSSTLHSWLACGSLFVLGWTLQLYGHHIEGNRPALMQNLLQILVAPFFLAAEALFALGLHRKLNAETRKALESADVST